MVGTTSKEGLGKVWKGFLFPIKNCIMKGERLIGYWRSNVFPSDAVKFMSVINHKLAEQCCFIYLTSQQRYMKEATDNKKAKTPFPGVRAAQVCLDCHLAKYSKTCHCTLQINSSPKLHLRLTKIIIITVMLQLFLEKWVMVFSCPSPNYHNLSMASFTSEPPCF